MSLYPFCPKRVSVVLYFKLHLILGFLTLGLLFNSDVRAAESQSRILSLLDAGAFDDALEVAFQLAKEGNSEGQYYLGMIPTYTNTDSYLGLAAQSMS